MAFDGKKFGEEFFEVVSAYVDKKTAEVRSELVLTQRAVDDLRRENSALLDMLAETAAPTARSPIDPRGL